MSIQPSIAPGKPRFPHGAARRSGRIDPPNAFHGTATPFHPEPIKAAWIETKDPALANLPVAPLAEAQPPSRKLSRKWLATIIASVTLHVAIAAWFMLGNYSDEMLIAGGEEIAVVQLGNADVNDTLAGEETISDSTQVTIIPITDAKPVETVEAQNVVVAATVTDTGAEIVQAVTTETVEPVIEPHLDAAKPETVQEIEPEIAAPMQAALLPRILATNVPEIVEDVETVAPVEDMVEPVEEPNQAEPEVKPLVKKPEPDRKLEVQRETARKAAAEKREAERAEQRMEAAKKKKQAAEAAAQKKTAEAKKAEAARQAAGNRGEGRSNAQKGRDDGVENGSKTASSGKGKSDAAGNAAITNYPGKVRAKVARAAGRIARSARKGASGDVVVSFSVTSSGGLGGVSVARSSGSPTLDAAAVAAVRKAAPFPAIPDGAGRSSWQFTIPMGLN